MENTTTKDTHVCAGLPSADRGVFRRARRNFEIGIVSVANVVGLALSVLIAVLLVAALVFPERF
ncbi:MAG: ATPase [Mycobacterium sp.]|nr:ATPase [Mycobacterium sp.]